MYIFTVEFEGESGPKYEGTLVLDPHDTETFCELHSEDGMTIYVKLTRKGD